MFLRDIISEAPRAPDGNRALLSYFMQRPVDFEDDRMRELWDVYKDEYHDADDDDSRAFADWLENEGHARILLHEDPHGCPSWMLMEPVKEALLPRKTWLVHFCKDADKVRREGFRFGVPDVANIALTRKHSVFGTTEHIRSKEPGYNFAYMADGSIKLTMRWSGYGKQVLLFQSSGLLVYHAGDKERQVVFWGPGADLGNARVIKATRHGFVADTGEKSRTIEDLVAGLRNGPPHA